MSAIVSVFRRGAVLLVSTGLSVTKYLLSFFDLKQRERSRPGRQTWRPEADIFSHSVLWIGKFVLQEFKQKLSILSSETEAFHQARHRTSGCYSWLPERRRSFLILSSLIVDCWFYFFPLDFFNSCRGLFNSSAASLKVPVKFIHTFCLIDRQTWREPSRTFPINPEPCRVFNTGRC